MAHFAEINDSNVVLRILVVDDKDTQDEDGNEVESIGAKFLSDTLGLGGTWKRTSYNTHKGVHVLGGTPFRKNPARIGGIYDEARDAFHLPQPYPSWTLDEDTCWWDSPVGPQPEGGLYEWNEDIQNWDDHEADRE